MLNDTYIDAQVSKGSATSDNRSTLAGGILEPSEIEIAERLMSQRRTQGGGLRDSQGLIMRTTLACNLSCNYCTLGHGVSLPAMSFLVLAQAISDALLDPGVQRVTFGWFGGEPTLTPLKVYHKALLLQRFFLRNGQSVSNCTSTNGTRITEETVKFWAENDFGVHVSLDGPAEVHDAWRRFNDGRSTFEAVSEGISILQVAGVPFTLNVVVSPAAIRMGPAKLLEFYANLHPREVRFLYMNPGMDTRGTLTEDPVVPFGDYMQFLRDVFKAWWPTLAKDLRIWPFAELLETIRGSRNRVCEHCGDCYGTIYTIEPDGDVYACEDFAGVATHRFGNLSQLSLSQCAHTRQMANLRRNHREAIARCRECDCFTLCRGGCPRWRLVMKDCASLKSLLHDIKASA